MKLSIDIYSTLALAAAALVIGHALVGRVAFLKRYSIPDAVVGGMLFAAVVTALRGTGVGLEFDPALITPLNIAFFTTVGLSADARSLARGGKLLLLFFFVVAGGLALQNVVGVGLARLFDIHPMNGLLAGSITLSGGHGTGAAWAGKFVDQRILQGAVELAVACATYGLVAGGLLGGPLAGWLIRRHGLSAASDGAAPASSRAAPAKATLAPTGAASAATANPVPPASAVAVPAAADEPLPLRRLIETLLLVFASMAIGMALYGLLGQGAFTLPSFIWALLVGAVIRNLLSLTGIYRVNDKAVETIGALSLSLFLAMIIMTLKLWELVDLAGPILAILLAQTVVMLAYVAFVTFRVMGGTYDAALLATGHLGFAMGSTATAMVNVQAVAERYGHSTLAFLLIPVMGAFLIDVANALVIQGFLQLPWFGL
jgi:ESS family glutamate:Na+ symporter